MAPRLKVYATRIGFHDVVVAAPNQRAALAAWDVRENLFAQGVAAPTEDKDAVEAALSHPGVVLSRPLGGGAYTKEAQVPSSAPSAPKAKSSAPAKAKATVKTKAKPAPRPPDRSALDAAERALDELEAEMRRTQEAFEKERRGLEAREAGARRELETRRRRLERERDLEQARYERAGDR